MRDAEGTAGADGEARPRDPALDELREAYESRQLIVFAGAGVSAAAGLPGWKRLVELLADSARARKADPATLAEIADLAGRGQFIEALSAAKDFLGAPEFGAVVERHLDDRRIDAPEIANAIAALAPKLRAVLTTNVDHLLERAFGGKWPVLSRATGDIARRERVILKLHGTLLDRSTWVFTREEYDRAMYADANLKGAFTALFNACPILFVGYGLQDDDFDLLLGRVRAFAGPQPPRHFALVDGKDVTPRRRRRLEDAGVRLIPYENPEGKHRAVVALLRGIPAPAPKSDPSRSHAPRSFGHAEVMELLEREGVREISSLKDVELDIQQRLLRVQSSGSEAHVRAILRLLALLGLEVVLAFALELLEDREPSGSDRRILEIVIGIPRQGPFVVALGPLAIVPGVVSSFIALAARITGAGGIVRVYALEGQTLPSVPGVEVVRSVEDALRPLVREALRAHATRCLEAWSDERERRFVEGRARLPWGDEFSVESAIDKALEANRCALLLGDFGTGKSTQMARRAARMARAYLAHEQQFPAPVLLPLTGRKPELSAIVAQIEGLPVEAFRLAVDLGMALPIFDGLDELAQESGAPDGAIAALCGAFAEPRARVILTSRRTVFPTPTRMSEALGGVTGLAVVELQGLDRAEVAAFVEKATLSAEDAEHTLESIKSTHDLENLAQRPALLELIIENRAKLSREDITASTLYRMATEDWLGSRRDQEHHVSRAQRFAFARALARSLFNSSAESVTYAEVARGVLDVLGDGFVLLDRPLLEVRLAVFLAFEEASDRFRFAHRSFLEYFLAVDIAERLDAGRPDALELPRLTPEIVAFLSGIEAWDRRRPKLQSMLVATYRPRASENALLALYHAARAKVGEGEALGALLDKEIPERARLSGARLSGVRLPWIALPGADLTGADLSQADLRFADLRNAQLDRAKADHAVFDGAVLDGARFREADVFATSFVDASLVAVWWDGACRRGTTLLGEVCTPEEVGGTTSPPAPYYHAQGSPANHVAWSPDGRWLACTAGASIQIRDAVTGAVRALLSGHQGDVRSVAFSPDGHALASGSFDEMVCLWDAQTGELRQTLSGHQGGVGSVAFSPDGCALASGSDDKTVRLWDAQTGELRQTLSGHQGYVRSVAFSPDGRALASGSYDQTVRLWDAQAGALRQTLSGHQGGVWSVAFSPDGCALTSGSDDKTVRLWDAQTGELRQTLSSHQGFVRSVAFSPDGRGLASGSYDQTVRLWNAQTGALHRTLSGHQSAVNSVAFSPDGCCLASGSVDQTVRLWDAQTGALCQALSGHRGGVGSVAFSPDGCCLASGSDSKTVRLWDAQTGELRQTLSGHQDVVNSVAFSPDGRALASGSYDKTVRLWDAQTGELRQTLSGHRGGVWSVAFSSDGVVLASGSNDKTVRLWDAQTGELRQTLSGHQSNVLSIAFSPDCCVLAAGSYDETVRLWDAQTGELRQTLSGHQGYVRSVAFSPDGRVLAAGSNDETVRLWDARTGELRQTLSGYQGVVRSVAFSPDGRTLAAGSYDKTVRLWDAQTGELRQTLPGHQGGIRSVAFSPDGRALASASNDQTVRLWDTRSGQCLVILHATEAGFVALAAGTPFFFAKGDLSQLLRFVSGERIMPAELWAPLFDRPDLVRAALAGNRPDLAALGLDTYAACERALVAERERRGLVRRRIKGPNAP